MKTNQELQVDYLISWCNGDCTAAQQIYSNAAQYQVYYSQ